jgi:tRNA modification GTPase
LPDGLRSADRTALQAYRDGTATLSAKTEEGLDRLRELIRARGLRSGFEPAERAMITQARHRAGLLASDEALGRAREAAASDLSTEFIAVDLRHALDALGEIIGVVTTDDVLDKIFKDFCIGK